MSALLAVLICTVCRGSRWVCFDHPLIPWHVGHLHCESHGTPCPACNPGPEFRPWNDRCLDCASAEEFEAACSQDDDVIFAAQVAGVDDPDIGDSMG